MTSVAKYSELGLVNTKRMFIRAMEGRYTIPAYNFNNMEQLQAILMGCSESQITGDLTMLGQRHKIHERYAAEVNGKRCSGDDAGSQRPCAGGPSPRPRRLL